MRNDYIIQHHGIKGQKWGVRRFQNEDGSLTPAGAERYGTNKVRKDKYHEENGTLNTKGIEKLAKLTDKDRNSKIETAAAIASGIPAALVGGAAITALTAVGAGVIIPMLTVEVAAISGMGAGAGVSVFIDKMRNTKIEKLLSTDPEMRKAVFDDSSNWVEDKKDK